MENTFHFFRKLCTTTKGYSSFMSTNNCINELMLEEYLLGVKMTNAERASIQTHIQICPDCRRVFRELVQYYEILENEIRKPISNKLLDFGYQSYPSGKSASIFIGFRITNGYKDFHYNYKVSIVKEKIKSFTDALDTLPPDAVLFRTITDKQTRTTVLFLYSNNGIDLSKSNLTLNNKLICRTNAFGAGKLTVSVDQLKNNIISIDTHPPEFAEFQVTDQIMHDFAF